MPAKLFLVGTFLVSTLSAAGQSSAPPQVSARWDMSLLPKLVQAISAQNFSPSGSNPHSKANSLTALWILSIRYTSRQTVILIA
ncbi:MAG: hypothetical protein AUI17_03705 [Acidobacteriales bacterium 13_2_20CM_2_55_5]|nr:MAG: hypothetical protein AUI17_03705 [Acidobacteriales bacterium 13_2_20CM_2_55_5]